MEGKSKLARFLFVYEPLKFAFSTGYDVKILYFALEDTKMGIYKRLMTHYTWENHHESLSAKYLNSIEKPIAPKFIDIIKHDRLFYQQIEECVFVVDNQTTPDGIYKSALKFREKFKDSHIIVLIDNYANIINDGTYQSEHAAIGKLSREYIRLQLCKEHEMSVLGIVQSDLDSIKYTARNAGKGAISTLEPNLGSFGNNKQISRDFHLIWSLFTPHRYEIPNYLGNQDNEGYDIRILRNKFKALLQLKTNNEEAAPRLCLYFDGLHEIFSEMPSLQNKEELDKIYRQIIQEEKEKIQKRTLFN